MVRSLSLSPVSREKEACLTYVLIEGVSTWTNFSRSYYLSCTVKTKCRDGSKITLTTPITDYNDAIGQAILLNKPRIQAPLGGIWHRRDEPAWHDSNILLKSCMNLGCSNLDKIQAAFSFGSRVFIDMPVFRNFYAHRNNQTEHAAKQLALQYRIRSDLRPSQILLTRPPTSHQYLLLDWLDDIYVTVELLCD